MDNMWRISRVLFHSRPNSASQPGTSGIISMGLFQPSQLNSLGGSVVPNSKKYTRRATSRTASIKPSTWWLAIILGWTMVGGEGLVKEHPSSHPRLLWSPRQAIHCWQASQTPTSSMPVDPIILCKQKLPHSTLKIRHPNTTRQFQLINRAMTRT